MCRIMVAIPVFRQVLYLRLLGEISQIRILLQNNYLVQVD
jgi:hypothetical protein